MTTKRRSRVDTVAEQIASLSPEELAELHQRLPQLAPSGPRKPRHSILELRGLGKDFWRSIDVEAYLKEERDSWGS